ncbi:hypothetical protein EDB81DRAFT_472172 [Dactylonectria macrodidyma]|uniref:Uncharacterized protein n=1 Tax=Dactylonectria macrodidyma TaxID=307937 RepID=A0A9P9J7V1_9HYPO|nr:hypothetical protein EDB81DRAFT_472172 [Dactylonectria macrodidyma]
MEVLVRDNHIKGGDVWFILKDFSLTLKAIGSSLKSYASSGESLEEDSNGWDESECEDLSGHGTMTPQTPEPVALDEMPKGKKQKSKTGIVDSWEDGSDDSESGAASDTSDTRSSLPGPPSAQKMQGEGLTNVVNAFTILQEDFECKFRKVWA